jgi:cytochrome c5
MKYLIIFATLLSFASLSSWAIDPFTLKIYESSCKICHGEGIGEAPKAFSNDAWSERLSKGQDTLLAHTIGGFKGMPPLGMCSDCTQEDLVDLIDYMSSEKVQ